MTNIIDTALTDKTALDLMQKCQSVHTQVTVFFYSHDDEQRARCARYAMKYLAEAAAAVGMKLEPVDAEPLRKIPKSEFIAKLDGLNTEGCDIEGTR